MCGNLVEGLCKELPCWERSLPCQIPSTQGRHCLVHLLLFWMERATSIPSATQSVCQARNRISKISVSDAEEKQAEAAVGRFLPRFCVTPIAHLGCQLDCTRDPLQPKVLGAPVRDFLHQII